jgi:hypothetical protein
MKTVLFLLLCSPLSAFASYSCHTLDATHNGLGVNESDPANIEVFYNHQVFAAVVTKDEGGPFGSKTYSLGNPVTVGTLTINAMPTHMTRGGSEFCGRAGCPPTHHSTLSATLVIESESAVQFTCNETTP